MPSRSDLGRALRRLALLAPLGLAGCADYLNHLDTVTLGAGDAVAFNRGVQTVDPWQRDAYNTHIHSNGTLAAGAVDTLLHPPAAPPPTQTIILPGAVAPSTGN